MKLKLPALYLIDSICKNIGQPYIDQFCAGGRLVQAYVASYRALGNDPEGLGLQKEFQRVLATWPGVIPADVLRDLETRLRPSNDRREPSRDGRSRKDEVQRDRSRDDRTHRQDVQKSPPKRRSSRERDRSRDVLRSRRAQSPRRHSRSPSGRPSSSSLKASSSSLKLNSTSSSSSSNSHKHSPQRRPSDNQHHLSHETAEQLQELLASVTVTDLKQYSALRVARALEALYRATDLPTSSTAAKLDQLAQSPDKRPLIEAIYELLPQKRPSLNYPPAPFQPIMPLMTYPIPNNSIPLAYPPVSAANMPMPYPTSTPMVNMPFNPQPPVVPSLIPENLQSLLATISTQLAVGPSPLIHKDQIPLTQEAIQIPRPGLHRRLYEDIGLRCATCSFRFYDNPEGKQLMARHLDAHFRRNMRLKDRSRRLIARDWLPTAAQWISYEGNDPLHPEKSSNDACKEVSPFAASNPPVEQQTKGAPDTSEATVAVGSDKPGRCCAICREILAVEWDHEQDEWVYRGAVRIEHEQEEKVAHVTCAGTL